MFQLVLNGFNTCQGVVLFLAFEFHNLRLGVLYEAFVAEFSLYAAQESLLVLQVCLEVLDLLIHIDERIHRDSKLRRADDELGAVGG